MNYKVAVEEKERERAGDNSQLTELIETGTRQRRNLLSER